MYVYSIDYYPVTYPMEQMNTPVIDELLHQLNEAHNIRVKDIAKSISITKSVITQGLSYQFHEIVAKAKSRLGFYYMINSDFIKATQFSNEALDFYKHTKDEIAVADIKYTLASVFYKSNQLYLGLHYIIECAKVYTKHKDNANAAKCYKVMGTIYEFFDDVDNAITAYNNAIAAADKAGDINMKTNAYNPLSGVLLNRGKIDRSLTLIESSINLKKQTGDVRGLAFAYYGRGKVFAKQKNYDWAEEDYNTAIKIHKEVGETLGTCMALNKLAELCILKQDIERAGKILNESLALSEGVQISIVKIRCYDLLYKVHKSKNDYPNALLFLEKYQNESNLLHQKQSKEILNSYALITEIETQALEAKLQLEKKEIIAEKDKAEYTAKARQDFLSLMSHEIRTPLNAIITISNLLKDSEQEEEQELINSLRHASNSLLVLVNDILDLSKLEETKVSLELSPVDFKDFFSKLKGTYESMAKEKGLSININYDNSLHEHYKIDAPKMSQVLGNLISNAIKFTEKGTIDIEVKIIENCGKQDKIYISVNDTGIGIQNEFLGSIFDAFSQSKNTLTKQHKGTGLGLTIAKNITKLYGSEIKINSTIGKGSTFYFEVMLEKIDTILKTVKYLEGDFSNLKILVVDDNKINLLVASRLLGKWKVQVETANSGKEAIAKSGTEHYDAIFMDIHMPLMNGYEATNIIRKSSSINRDTQILALTADVTINKNDTIPIEIFNGVLKKPIVKEELYSVLSGLIECKENVV